ncbi:hypothetical protein [Rufibacter ruber]|uniref:hypothetical protein n=1 Tax=Rufibacter ruber TaxID=1783499 RepID=UPI0012900ABB|nr:hypothetical protein [Rufibacter ruber]
MGFRTGANGRTKGSADYAYLPQPGEQQTSHCSISNWQLLTYGSHRQGNLKRHIAFRTADQSFPLQSA